MRLPPPPPPPSRLVEELVAARGGKLQATPPDNLDLDLDAALTRLVAEGAAAHPDLPLADAETAWARHLGTHLALGDDADAVAAQLASIHAADVHLVLACLAKSAAAHARLDERLRGVMRQALVGIRLSTTSSTNDELLQDLRAKLLVGEDGVGKIASYAGRGPLDGWLRVTIARAALSLVRSQMTEPAMVGSDEPAALAAIAGAQNPELEALRVRAAPVLERAIAEALDALDDANKTLLKMHFVDGLTIDDLAVIHRLHRATIARRIARARTTVFEDARTRAIASLGGGEAEFESLVGVVLSGLDVTLRRLLNVNVKVNVNVNNVTKMKSEP